MLELLKNVFLSSLIISIVNIYIMHKIYNNKIKFKERSIYFYFLMLVTVTTLNCAFIINELRISSIILMLIPINWYLFRKDLNTSIATTVTYEIIMILAEMIYAIGLFILIPTDNVVNRVIGDVLSNITIGIIAIILIRFNFFRKLSEILLDTINNIKKYEVFVLLTIVILTINFLLMASYAKISLPNLLILNALLIVIYSFIIFRFISIKHTYQEIYGKYNSTLSSLHEYEEMMDRYRISNHENKNTLQTIQAMLLKKEENISKFIDSVVNDKLMYNENLMYKTSAIPEGGLRAIIYAKLATMKDKDIQFDFKVDNQVRRVSLLKLGEKVMLDICKIVGVYLDNAIEAVENLDKREIGIKLYLDEGYLCVKISNNYKGHIEDDKIDEIKYTTKANGHGYGLTMVKEILEQNRYLENERQVNGQVFTQILKIKTS